MNRITFLRMAEVVVAMSVWPLVAWADADSPASEFRVSFTREVVNLEDIGSQLDRTPPRTVRRGPRSERELWFGEIFRQVPGDAPTSREHNVPFAVALDDSGLVRVWCDANLNGDLTDDPEPPLSRFPAERPARSFLATLRWSAEWEGRSRPLERIVRVVVETPDSVSRVKYRTQNVHGQLGSMEVGGNSIRVLLHDGNRDGFYTRGHSDGVFFDLDGDGRFVLDVMGPDFGPLAIPFTLKGRRYAADSVALDGSSVVLRDLGPAPDNRGPIVGQPAPDFSFIDLEGRFVRLGALRGRIVAVYFWASWCGACRRDAEALRALYERSSRENFEIIGISYDTERTAAIAFRREHGLTWPTSFTGGFPAEDPVGRLYREGGAGVFYVVGPDGRLVKQAFSAADVEATLNGLAMGDRGNTR